MEKVSTRKNGDERPGTEPARPVNGSNGATVVVALKWPTAILLRTFTMDDTTETLPGGGARDLKVARADPVKYVIKGTATPSGKVPQTLQLAGYAFTSGVPLDFWAKWREQNRDHFLVKDNLIFALPTIEAAESEAKNNVALRTGLEPLNPNGDARGIKVEQAPEQKAELTTLNWFSPSLEL